MTTRVKPPASRAQNLTGRRPSGAFRIGVVLTAAACLYGLIAALRRAWVTDDAFISFRYAHNLVRGLGLVYNAGERVEGYSNFLWTLWTALGLRLGVTAETWSVFWGLAFYVGTIALLCASSLRARAAEGRWFLAVPLAGLIAAVHPDWNVFATSGLETSLFVFLAVLGFVLAVDQSLGVRGSAAAGLAFALASLTRPDGVLFAGLAGLFVIWARRPRLRSALAFGGVFLAAWLPYVAWKIAYYGDVFPNTYYAKSAALAWYSQGWLYVRLYFQKYWPLAAALPLAAVALALPARGEAAEAARRHAAHEAVLAAAFALAYTFYVLRVGGDFMYARLLLPATPFFLILLERAIARLASGRALIGAACSVVALAATALMPYPYKADGWVGGIVNEWAFYTRDKIAEMKGEGAVLRRYFDGLPVRVAFVGSQAALAYYADPATAIEAQTGLTDRWIAHQPIAKRGRIGHEKLAPLAYLIERRHVHCVIHHFAGVALGLDDSIPNVPIAFDNVPGRLLTWDPLMLHDLAQRGARFPDFPALLDRYLASLDRVPDQQLGSDYPKLKRFYFEHVQDPAREAPLLARLARMKAPPG